MATVEQSDQPKPASRPEASFWDLAEREHRKWS